MAIVTTLANAHAAHDPAVSVFRGDAADLIMRRAAVPSDGVVEAPHLAAHAAFAPISPLLHVDDGNENIAGSAVYDLIGHVTHGPKLPRRLLGRDVVIQDRREAGKRRPWNLVLVELQFRCLEAVEFDR